MIIFLHQVDSLHVSDLPMMLLIQLHLQKPEQIMNRLQCHKTRLFSVRTAFDMSS
jgi:hypothetical protein